MVIDKSYLGRMVLGAALVFFVILLPILFADIQVSSQQGEAGREKQVSNNKQAKSGKDDGYQELIDLLTEDNKGTTPAKKIDAIKRLGNSRATRAIPVLVKYLDYEDGSLPVRSADRIDITEQDDVSPAKRYPAIGSLTQMRKAALPALVTVIENQPTGSTRSKNARSAVQYIFLSEGVLDGVLYLERAASESNVPEGSERLLTAAQEMRVILEKIQR